MYNWDVKIPGKEKKNYYCKEHKFSLMFTGLFILFIEATTTTSPLVPPPPPSLLPTLSSTTGSTPGIARNFTHRSELYASLLYYFTARYFTHDQFEEWKYSDFRGEISYFTHELHAQNCIKIFMFEAFL